MRKYNMPMAARGFVKRLFSYINSNSKNIYVNMPKNSYEKISKSKILMHRIFNMKIFDLLGVFQVVVSNPKQREAGSISFNRFLRTSKPYCIILENPYALVNYADKRMNYYIAKRKLRTLFSDTNLREIICISDACKESVSLVYDSIPKRIKITRLYPLVQRGELTKKYGREINLLFITSNFWLKGGGEIIEAFKVVRKKYNRDDIKLTVVTPLEKISSKVKEKLKSLQIDLIDYKLSKEELNDLYDGAHIILNPTRMDSFSLVTLEAIKYGCAYIGTNLYAIPEMITDQENGFLHPSIFSPWKSNNTFDHHKRMKINKLSKEGKIDKELVFFMVEKILYLKENIDQLKKMNESSYKKSNTIDFSEKEILHQWEQVLYKM